MTPNPETHADVSQPELGLKAVREAKGVSLKDIFLATRITTVNLDAIEGGHFHLLPEPVYARTFIKTYARFLNIDPNPILEHYDKYIQSLQAPAIPENEKDKQEKTDRQPAAGRNLIMRTSVLILVMVMALAVYYLIFHNDPAILRISQPQPAKVSQPVPAPAVESAKPAPSPVVEQQTAAPQKEAVPEKRYHLLINASEKTWLRIREDQKQPEEILLSRDQSIDRFATDSFTLDIGNAGGIELTFQGKSLGKMGKRGEVIHMRLP